MSERRRGVGRLKDFAPAVTGQRERGERAVGGEFDDRHGLQVGVAHQRLETGLGKLARDPLDGDLRAVLQRQAAFQRVGGKEG